MRLVGHGKWFAYFNGDTLKGSEQRAYDLIYVL